MLPSVGLATHNSDRNEPSVGGVVVGFEEPAPKRWREAGVGYRMAASGLGRQRQSADGDGVFAETGEE